VTRIDTPPHRFESTHHIEVIIVPLARPLPPRTARVLDRSLARLPVASRVAESPARSVAAKIHVAASPPERAPSTTFDARRVARRRANESVARNKTFPTACLARRLETPLASRASPPIASHRPVIAGD